MIKLMNKEKPKNLKINIIFNALYQVLILIIPFITSPYISRVLLPSGVGSYSYAYSIVTYFIPLADYGFLEYGTVLIAKHRQNKNDYSEIFWDLFLCKFILGILITSIYLLLVGCNVFYSSGFEANTKIVFIIMSLDILSYAFDITFLFQGLEKFVSLCVRNLILKLLNLILIFVFVRTSSDYLNYVIVISIGLFLTGFSTLITIPFSVKKPVKHKICFFNHFKQAFVYFIPYLVSTAYLVIPKTFLGLLVKDSNISGYYESADKLINIILTLVGSINTIIMSRMSYLYQIGDEEEIKRKTSQVFTIYGYIALPCFFGIICVNKFFTPGFFGLEYSSVIFYVYIMAAKILFNPLPKIIGAVYFVPVGKAWTRTILLLISLGLNLILSFIFTYSFGVVGTCIASLISEFISAFLFIIVSWKYIHISYKNTIDMVKCFDASLIMTICLYFVSTYISSAFNPSTTTKLILFSILEIIIGGLIYLICTILFKEDIISTTLKNIKQKISQKLHR